MNPEGSLARTLRYALTHTLRVPARMRGLRVLHGERLREDKVIITCNHAAFADTFWLRMGIEGEFAVCGAKPRLFRTAPLRALMGVADIRRINDRGSFLRQTHDLLQAGRRVLVYPEMGRNPGGMGPFLPWAAEAALNASACLQPCYLSGTTSGNQGAPILVVGRPVAPEGNPSTLTAVLRDATEELKQEVRA